MAKVVVTESYLENIGSAIRSKLGTQDTYSPSEMAGAISQIHGDPVLETLSATQNGTYTPSSGKDGFSQAVVNVPNSYAAGDEGKVVSNGALVAQTSQNITENGTYDTTLKDEVVVNVSGGGGSGSKTYTGTDAPSSSLGNIGDYYVRYGATGFIENTNTQYIDTGISGTDAYGYKIIFAPISQNNAYQSYLSGYVDNFTIGAYGNINSYYERLRGNQVRSGSLIPSGKNTLERQNNQPLSTNSANICVFADSNGTTNRISCMRLYELVLYDAVGNEIFHGLPCEDANDVACLYDLVSDTYKYNSGTGNFTYTKIQERVILATYVKTGSSAQDAQWILTDSISVYNGVFVEENAPSSSMGIDEDLYIKIQSYSDTYDHKLGIEHIYRKVNGTWVDYIDPAPIS